MARAALDEGRADDSRVAVGCGELGEVEVKARARSARAAGGRQARLR